jgi:hypothetical protein
VSHDKVRVGNIPSGIAPSDLFVPNRKQFNTNILFNFVAREDIYISKVHPITGHEGPDVE